MELAYTLGGGAPVIKRYQAGEAVANAGVPLIGVNVAAGGATDIGSVIPIANASAGPIMGLSVDTTSQTPAATGITSDAAITVSVIVNPDAVYRARLSGGATADTALATTEAGAASATGVLVSGGTTMDDGVVWGYSGANKGSYRRADDTAGSIAMNFVNGIAQGDLFLYAQGFIGFGEVATQAFFDLTSDFTQVVAQTADSDNDNFMICDWELRDEDDSGTTNSYYHLVANNHIFGGNLLLGIARD